MSLAHAAFYGSKPCLRRVIVLFWPIWLDHNL